MIFIWVIFHYISKIYLRNFFGFVSLDVMISQCYIPLHNDMIMQKHYLWMLGVYMISCIILCLIKVYMCIYI